MQEITQPQSSHERAIERFSRPRVASAYPSVYGKTYRDKRESACILESLTDVSRRATVLDLPCGTGRLTRLLLEEGYRVSGADVSEAMVENARANIGSWRRTARPDLPEADFYVREVVNSGFADDQFDAVICNRLFHHFTESETRVAAFHELGRICRGTISVSFFNSFALDAAKRKLKNRLKGIVPNDRVPISTSLIQNEAREAGLKVERMIATRWGISPHWYLVARKERN